MADDRALLVRHAERIATAAHRGHVDHTGRWYIDHARRVAALLAGDDRAEAVGWLHGAVAHGRLLLPNLIAVGLPPPVVDAVAVLTGRAGETGAEHDARVAAGPLASQVRAACAMARRQEGERP